jgi:hypothetical protein
LDAAYTIIFDSKKIFKIHFTFAKRNTNAVYFVEEKFIFFGDDDEFLAFGDI